jgi:adenine-specific DNA methylase
METCRDLEFDSVLDVFGGTGSVSYEFKRRGKLTTYNDLLAFNQQIGTALIENSHKRLQKSDVEYLLTRHRDVNYPTFIADTFRDIYFTDEENEWLDIVAANIRTLEDNYDRALAYFALFQTCIIKRPFNLFHRKNLYVRFANVDRHFGNKATWDKPANEYFGKFAEEANAAVFSNGRANTAIGVDALECPVERYDLVYIDPPYISTNGVGVNYMRFYHFLEGLTRYQEWPKLIDWNSKHREIRAPPSAWTSRTQVVRALETLFARHSRSILVLSYRTPGYPSVEHLVALMARHKKRVAVEKIDYRYVLAKPIDNGDSRGEVLIIGA